MNDHAEQVNGEIIRRWLDDPDFFDTVEGQRYLDSIEEIYGNPPDLDTPDYWAN